MKISFNQKLFALFFLVLAGIALAGYAVYKSNQRLVNSVQWVYHTRQVIYQTDIILSLAQDMETASRGFIISGDSSFLAPLWTADQTIFSNVKGLKNLTADNPDQQRRVDSLNLYLRKRLNFSLQSVALRNKEGLLAACALVSTGQGKLYTDHVRQLAADMQQEESILLAQRQQANQHNIALLNSVSLAMFVSMGLLAILLLAVTVNYSRQQQKHEREAKQWNAELEQKINEISDFKALFESAPGLYLILLPDLVIDAVSDEYLQATMTKRSEITGRHLFDVFPDNPNDPHADGVSNLRNSLNTVLKTRAAHAMAIQKYDVRRPDGTFEERFWSPLNKPVLNALGEVVYIIHSVQDVTLRIRHEQELLRATNEIKELYNEAPCGYFSVNADIFVSNINQTLLNWLGYAPEEVVGKKKFEDLLSPGSRAAHLATFNEVFAEYLKNGYVNNLEYEFQRKNGSTFPALVNSVAVLDDKGNFIKSRSTVFDNTERKKAEGKLKAANAELESFSYSVSHDLRAPLRAIHGYAKILKEDYASLFDAEANRVLNNITGNAKKMGQLIDDLLTFSRLGRKDLQLNTIGIQEFVGGICTELKSEYGERNIEFVIKPLPPVRADEIALKQVWVNLISNAIKYTRQKDKAIIEIGSEIRNDEFIYYIKDNGAGFDMRYADKLFGVFQRLHSEDEFEGTGVGLAIVKRIVTKHGGSVWAGGITGEGATFYFSLPKN